MKRLLTAWWRNDSAVMALEAGLLFPVLATIMMGVVDIGSGLVTNQKLVNASHMVADLLAREDDITDAEFTDSVVAGEMAMNPYDTTSFGYDVVGIRFEEEELTPTVIWRETFNMPENASAEADSEGLGSEDEGVIVVTLKFLYVPVFSEFMTGPITMEEVAFARGRKGYFVTRS